MKLGIVGSEGSKFTQVGESRARQAIRDLIHKYQPSHVVSGHCHLGGIDIWAEEVADEFGIAKEIYPPAEHNWNGGYKPRNLQIAHNSDRVVCITVDSLPANYKGMVFKGCYHCDKALGLRVESASPEHSEGRLLKDVFKPHVKSGGCWTVIQGAKQGKEGEWTVIQNI